MIASSFTNLPNEVLQQIFQYLPPTSAATFLQLSRRFATLADPILWRHYYIAQYKYGEPKRRELDSSRKEVHHVDWKRLFADRYLIDQEIRCGLNRVLTSQEGRIEKIQKIVSYGEDAKDVLLGESSALDDKEDVLARR